MKMIWKIILSLFVIGIIVFCGMAIFGGSSDNTTTIVVESDGAYSGSIGGLNDGQRTIEGNGDQNFTVNDTYASACVQKDAFNSGEILTVKIVRDGNIIQEQTTTAEYGVVTVSG